MRSLLALKWPSDDFAQPEQTHVLFRITIAFDESFAMTIITQIPSISTRRYQTCPRLRKPVPFMLLTPFSMSFHAAYIDYRTSPELVDVTPMHY